MTALFKSPKMQASPKPPTIDDARMNLDARKVVAQRQGRASNIIAGNVGAPAESGTAGGPATKILLGQ